MTSTHAGTGTIGSTDGTALSASFYNPTGLVVDGMVIYVSDYQNHKTRKIDRYGYSISPTLPNGFVFDEATGTISGTPTESVSPTDFVVTATNSFESDSFVVKSALGTPSEVKFSAEAIVIFPNPVKDRVSVHTNQPIHSLNIYTFFGSRSYEFGYHFNSSD